MGKRPEKNFKKPVPQVSHSSQRSWEPWIIAALALICYVPTMWYGFALDDAGAITDNYLVKNGMQSIPELCRTHYRYGYWSANGDLYRPLSLILFAIEYTFGKGSPMIHHVMNVVFYTLLCLAMYALLKQMRYAFAGPIAFIATCIFAVHPIHTEVVANIKSRDELCSLFFAVLSILFFVKYQTVHKKGSLFFAIIFYTLALFSKESAVMLGLLFPIALVYILEVSWKKAILKSSIFIFPVLIYLLARYAVLGGMNSQGAISPLDNVIASAQTISQHISGALLHTFWYLKQCILPWPLVHDRGMAQIPLSHWGDLKVWIAFLVLGGGIIFTFLGLLRKNIFGLAGIWFFPSYFLISNLFFLIGTSYGERLLFTPSVGIAILIAGVIFSIPGIRNKFDISQNKQSQNISPYQLVLSSPVVGILTGLILLIFIGIVWNRNPAWKNSFTLYSTDTQKSPHSIKLKYHYALELGKQVTDQDPPAIRNPILQQAIRALDSVTRMSPTYFDAWGTMGIYKYRLGQSSEALEDYKKAVKLNPGLAIAWSNMGIIYKDRRQLDSCIYVYKMALAADPRFSDAHMNLGAVLAANGKFQEAIPELEAAIKYNPENANAYFMLGNAYKDTGDPAKGKPYLEQACALDPQFCR